MRKLNCPNRLLATAVAILALGLAVSACQSKSACAKNGATAEVAGSHRHSLSIPAEHIARMVGGTYSLSSEPGHGHAVHLTDADMKQLAEGNPVETRATSVEGHTHEVRLTCAP
jgi:hypothetical protein